MKVYFDVSNFNPEKVSGISAYTFQLLHYLRNKKELNLVLVLKPSRFKKKNKLEKALHSKIKILWPWVGLFEKNALYHGPDFKINIGKTLPRVVTIHDVAVMEKKYGAPRFIDKGIKDLSNALSAKPTAILAVSEFTKKQIIKYFPDLEKCISVTLLGSDRLEAPAPATFCGEVPPSYILFLGTLEKRKNVVGVIKSFEILCQQGHHESLILAGAWGYGADEIKEALQQSPYRNRITHLDYVADSQLSHLLKKARVFVFPSWYEGFGLPALEAMAHGCPVVTARGGSLEEITGSAALHAAPESPEDIATQIARLLKDENLRHEMILRGHQRVSQFTWQKCAEETFAVYEKLVSPK